MQAIILLFVIAAVRTTAAPSPQTQLAKLNDLPQTPNILHGRGLVDSHNHLSVITKRSICGSGKLMRRGACMSKPGQKSSDTQQTSTAPTEQPGSSRALSTQGSIQSQGEARSQEVADAIARSQARSRARESTQAQAQTQAQARTEARQLSRTQTQARLQEAAQARAETQRQTRAQTQVRLQEAAEARARANARRAQAQAGVQIQPGDFRVGPQSPRLSPGSTSSESLSPRNSLERQPARDWASARVDPRLFWVNPNAVPGSAMRSRTPPHEVLQRLHAVNRPPSNPSSETPTPADSAYGDGRQPYN